MDQEMDEYLLSSNDWAPLFHINTKETFLQTQNNPFLGRILFGIIDQLFPRKETLIKPDFPSYLPLKIAILGVSFAGKKTVSSLLKQKYGVEAIVPEDIVKEAIIYAFPPEDVIDPKKPKKKPEKNDKKSEEIVKENPELKALGIKAKGFEGVFPDEILMEAVLLKIKSVFPKKNSEELKIDLTEEKNKAAEKLKEIRRLQEETDKKNKKLKSNATKAAQKKAQGKQPDVPVNVIEEISLTPEEKMQELINRNPFYYTKGFVIINFPQNLSQVKKPIKNFFSLSKPFIFSI